MNRRVLIATLLILAAIEAPIVVYLCVFGTSISSNHTRWAEFGSAIGGIYSPLVALLTLFVVLRQVKLQSQMNEHEFDQAYLQQAREDIEFYSTQMAQALDGLALPGKNCVPFYMRILHIQLRQIWTHNNCVNLLPIFTA